MGDLRKLTKRARRVSARAEAGAEAGERRAAGGEQAALKEEAVAAGYELEAEAEAAAGGDVEEEAGAAAEAAAAGAGAIDPMRGCVGSLRQLVRLSDFVSSNLAERQTKGDRSEIAFHVGQVPRHQHARTHARTRTLGMPPRLIISPYQVLRHRKYGYRAAIFGWERRPQVDVSGWDGVQGLPSGPDQPFYRALPDMGDCVELLGGPRGVRCDAPPAPPWRDTPPQRAAPPLIASGTSPRRTSSQSRPRRTARSRMISCRTSSRTSTPSERPTAPCSSCACGTRPTTSPHPRRSQSCNSSGSTVWCVRRRRPLMPTRCSPDANPMQS
jgi:hypothetical protein